MAALNRRDTADFDCRLAVDRADRFGDVDVAAGGDPGEHPLDHDLAQQILRRERLPRRQLDLAAVDVAAPRPGDGDLLRARARPDRSSCHASSRPAPAPSLACFGPTIEASSSVSICCITTSPAAVENASSPSRIAAATSAIATVASNGRPASSAAASGVVIFTTGTFFIR